MRSKPGVGTGASGGIPTPVSNRGQGRVAEPVLTDLLSRYIASAGPDAVGQLAGLGLSATEADRFFLLCGRQIGEMLNTLDSSAFAVAGVAEQISMLLARCDTGATARLTGISAALTQSAAALLVLDFVLYAASLRDGLTHHG